MTVPVCTDEHVPSVFVTTLRSNGYEVIRARDHFGEQTDDRRLLRFCADEDLVLVTHDKKDFSGAVAEEVAHAGIVIYTDATFLRDEPGAAAETLDRVLEYYPRPELRGEKIWLDRWRRQG